MGRACRCIYFGPNQQGTLWALVFLTEKEVAASGQNRAGIEAERAQPTEQPVGRSAWGDRWGLYHKTQGFINQAWWCMPVNQAPRRLRQER